MVKKAKRKSPIVLVIPPEPPKPKTPRVLWPEGAKNDMTTFSELGMGPTAERK